MPYDNFDDWQCLVGVFEENGKVGEIISLMPKLTSKKTYFSCLPAFNIHRLLQLGIDLLKILGCSLQASFYIVFALIDLNLLK